MLNNPYINRAVKINYIVVDCKKDAFDVEEDKALALRNGATSRRAIYHLRKSEAAAQVRQALNVWYYS